MLSPEVAEYLKISSQENKVSLADFQEVVSRSKGILNEIQSISGSWNPVELYTPVNVFEEKEKFLAAWSRGEKYYPHFIYRTDICAAVVSVKERFEQLRLDIQDIESNTRAENIFKEYLLLKINDDLSTCLLAQGLINQDEEMIRKAFHAKYPSVDAALIEEAENTYQRLVTDDREKVVYERLLTVEQEEVLKNTELDAVDLRDALEWALNQYGLLDNQIFRYKVVIDTNATAVDVRDKSLNGPTVFIPENRKLSAMKLIQLIGHEIEGHARQSYNGYVLFGIAGGSVRMDDEMLYEGLGLRYDELVRKELSGNDTGLPLPYYTFAVRDAENGLGFYEIFESQLRSRLKVKFPDQADIEFSDLDKLEPNVREKVITECWNTTYRIMRGHIDTINSNNWAMTKDLSYLKGWKIDHELRSLGFGFINEAGIISSRAISLIAQIDYGEKDLPLPFQNVALKYFKEVLYPKIF